MLEGYLQTRATLRAVILLVDMRRGVEDDDQALIDFMLTRPAPPESTKPVEVVVVARPSAIKVAPCCTAAPARMEVRQARPRRGEFDGLQRTVDGGAWAE